MTAIPDRVEQLTGIRLEHGSHSSREKGMCAMEAVAWLANEPHSDKPECACPIIAQFVRAWNDVLTDEERNRYLPTFLPRLIGTKSTKLVQERRGWMLMDWLTREFAPAWLELRPTLLEHAAKLRGLAEIVDGDTARAAVVIAEVAATAADDDWSAADSAAYSAARSAARSAAYSAADSAARSAAYSAADSAADSAAYSAARSAADSAAYSAARSAAYSAADSAARSAARDLLRPVTEKLQKSALLLLDRLIAVTDGETSAKAVA